LHPLITSIASLVTIAASVLRSKGENRG